MTSHDVFEANRARAQIALRVGLLQGRNRAVHVREEGSMRVRFPNAAGGALETILVNTAGGLAGGDCFEFELAVDAGAAVTLTTASAEKVYRSLGPASRVAVRLTVADGGRLAWLPQETILFDAARIERAIDIELSGSGQLLLAEGFVFGRAAMGETVDTGRLFDHWRLRQAGRLIYADALRLDGAVRHSLAAAATARGGAGVATILIAPGGEAEAARLRTASAALAGEAGISAWNGICAARLCASDGAALRTDMAILLAALDAPLPRIWQN